MQEQQLERVPLSAPVGVELMRVRKGCKHRREKRRQQNPSTRGCGSLPGPLATSHCLPEHTPREVACPWGAKLHSQVSCTGRPSSGSLVRLLCELAPAARKQT